MASILVLAKSGFGKTQSYCGRQKFGLKGLNPKETYVIQCVNRNLPNPEFKLTTTDKPASGNRIQVGNIPGLDKFVFVANLITNLASAQSPYKNIVIDDFNYLGQDYYMANAMKGGWDTPKQIGYGLGLIFQAMQNIPETKNIICLAHYEEYKDKNGDSLSYRFKSVGNMVDAYISPEGKFDIVLYGKSSFNAETKQPQKEFVINYDGEYPAKDSLGVLDDLPNYIPNDLNIVISKIKERYGE